jgi:hypothetical protein
MRASKKGNRWSPFALLMHALSYPIHRSHIKSKTDFLYSQLKGESRKGNARGREGGGGA